MKHEIEIPGLPEGWKPVSIKLCNSTYHNPDGSRDIICHLRIEKIQPRRIVLEEISREEYQRLFHEGETQVFSMAGSHWHEVKEGKS